MKDMHEMNNRYNNTEDQTTESTSNAPKIYMREEDLPQKHQKRKRPSIREIMRKKELDPEKASQLEKNDFLALVIAAGSVFLPVIIAAFAVVALIIWLFT